MKLEVRRCTRSQYRRASGIEEKIVGMDWMACTPSSLVFWWCEAGRGSTKDMIWRSRREKACTSSSSTVCSAGEEIHSLDMSVYLTWDTQFCSSLIPEMAW